jgi:hypothetical protein
MESQVIITIGWILLNYSRYDGGDEDAGTLMELAMALDRIILPTIILVFIIFVIKSIFSGNSKPGPVQGGRQTDSIPRVSTNNNSIAQTSERSSPKSKREIPPYHQQDYQNRKFLTLKERAENEWMSNQRKTLFDITNLAYFAQHVRRLVVQHDESVIFGVRLLDEYWTFDGEWRQGYWRGMSDYDNPFFLLDSNSKNQNQNSRCDYLDTAWGHIQPESAFHYLPAEDRPSVNNTTLMKFIGNSGFWSQQTEEVKNEIFYNLNPYQITNVDVDFLKSTLSQGDYHLYIHAKMKRSTQNDIENTEQERYLMSLSNDVG